MNVCSAAMLFQSARKSALAAGLCAAGLAVEMKAQSVAPVVPNALRLVVVNDHDIPIPLAEVTIRQGQLRAAGRTDSAGMFRVEAIPLGTWQASVRRIGFNETVLDLPIAVGENAYTITVDGTLRTLTDVKVVDKAGMSSRLAGFETRKARGQPSAVITREQIEKRHPIVLSQMFRGLPGLQVAAEQGAAYPVAARGTVPKGAGAVGACPMRVAVDGVVRPLLSSLDDINPSDVHGVEVYYGPANLPLQFANSRTDNWCGLVVIWTRDK